jgi:hypothetical protein
MWDISIYLFKVIAASNIISISLQIELLIVSKYKD